MSGGSILLGVIHQVRTQNFPKNISYPSAEICNFDKKETLAQVFSGEFCQISKNTFVTEHLQATASLNKKSRILIYISYP